MQFLLELPEGNQEVSIETHALKEAIGLSSRFNYKMTVSKYFDNLGSWNTIPEQLQQDLTETVPVGSINFVQSYLKKVHGICTMNPIEVPERLRIPKMLLRDYQIVKYEDLPKTGTWFIKDVSVLKNGSYTGLASPEFYSQLDPTHLYQVSSVINVMSEYRVFVYKDTIQGIQFYDGDVLILPTPEEINKIREAVVRYSVARDCPIAYTMDWAIINTGCKKTPRDIAILEVHPFVSVGTYGLEGPILLNMYKQGLQWYIKHNTPLTPEEPGGNTHAFF